MKKKCLLIPLFLILAMLLVGCNGGEGITTPPVSTVTGNQSPTASFTAYPTSGVAPLEVSFSASNSSDSDGTILSYQWDFKDGNTGNGLTINHTFISTGSYNVGLTVTDNMGAIGSITKTITVTTPESTPEPVPTPEPDEVGEDFVVCENLLRGMYAALSNQNFTQALSYCKPEGITYNYIYDLWSTAQEWPQVYLTYQIHSAYNFSHIGQSVVSFNYDLSYTGHSIYGDTYDTNYSYGLLAGFEKVNGEWKMP